MKQLSEMSTGHIIIEGFLLLVALFAAVYVIYSLFKVFSFVFPNETPDKSEMSARVRYEQTEELMNEIKNNQNSIK